MRGFSEMYILSQVLVVLSDVLCILSMLSGKKKWIVFYFILSTILFVSHYICLGGWTGAVIGTVDLVFLILMYILELKNKQKYNPYLSVATIIITILLSIITWDGWVSLLPMVAMIVYLFGMMFTNVIFVKSGAFVRLVLNGLYMFMLKSYFGAGLSIVILAFTVAGIINDCKRNKQEQTANITQDTSSRDE